MLRKERLEKKTLQDEEEEKVSSSFGMEEMSSEVDVGPEPTKTHHPIPSHHHPSLPYSPLLQENCPANCRHGHQRDKLSHDSGPESSLPGQGICDRIEAHLLHLGKGTTWLGIFLGQLCSALFCLSSLASVILTDVQVRLPNAQNFAFYLLLSVVFTSVLACRRGERNLFPVLRLRGWKYVLVALADVEGNFLMVKAYQFTTLTSIQLLDCFTIPTVLSLSWLILRVRFKVPHILGVFICLLGVSCLVWADVDSDGRYIGTGKDRFIGDMMSLAGAFLHGISGVAQEFVVKTFDWVEFLGMVGVIGSLACGLQIMMLEYGSIVESPWTGQTISLIALYAVGQFFFYCLGAIVIKLSSATALNLSVLSADFYALIVGIQLFEYKFHALYFLSFVLVMSGVLVFSIKPTSTAAHLYRSLVREQTTITTDLELIASGTVLPPDSYEPHGGSDNYTSSTFSNYTNVCPQQSYTSFSYNHHHHHHHGTSFQHQHPYPLHHITDHQDEHQLKYLESRNGETYVIPEESENC